MILSDMNVNDDRRGVSAMASEGNGLARTVLDDCLDFVREDHLGG